MKFKRYTVLASCTQHSGCPVRTWGHSGVPVGPSRHRGRGPEDDGGGWSKQDTSSFGAARDRHAGPDRAAMEQRAVAGRGHHGGDDEGPCMEVMTRGHAWRQQEAGDNTEQMEDTGPARDEDDQTPEVEPLTGSPRSDNFSDSVVGDLAESVHEWGFDNDLFVPTRAGSG